jgi:glycosyltransferase involved in cell wall biosynthesis
MVGGPGVLSYGGDAIRLYTAHEHWLVCPMHVLWRHDREPCDGRECLRCALSYRRPPQLYRYSGYMERQLDHVDVFFAQSEFSRRKHAEFGFGRPMEVLPPFLPTEDPTGADRVPSAGGREAPFVLFAGRLERIKGLDDVIPHFRDDPPAGLVVAGTGTHRAELERLARGSPSVRFLGQVSNRDVQALMRDAVAVLVPSVGFETFGFTALEAFRAGTPVVARRSGPLPELVEATGGGTLFDRPEEVVDAVGLLVSDPAHRRRLGEAGRAGFLQHWSEDVVMARYLKHIETAHDARGRS